MQKGKLISRWLAAAGVGLTALAVACGGAAQPTATTAPPRAPTLVPTITPTPSPAPSPTPLAVRPKPAGKITVGDTVITFANGFDVHGVPGGGAWVVVRNMGAHVLCFECPEDLTGGPAPGLASSWDISSNGFVWTFKLRPNAKFHNGAPVTASDIAFSLQRALDPRLANARVGEIRANIETVEAPDPLTAVFKTKSPNSAWLGRILDQGTFPVPQKYVEEVGFEAFGKRPVAAGPWKFVEGVPGERVVMEAFEDVYDPDRVPRVKTLEVRVIPEASTRVAALRAGELDLIPSVSGPQIKEISSDPNLRLVSAGFALAPSVVFDLLAGREYPWTKELKVRQAMNTSIDRDAIAKKLYDGRARGVASGYNPCMFGYNPALDTSPPFNPTRAKELLSEAGYPNGFETTLSFSAGARDLYQAVAGYWEAIGIKIKVNPLEGGAYSQQYVRKELKGLTATSESCSDKLDPAHLYTHYGKGGPLGYNDTPESEELFTKLREASDPGVRKQLGGQLQKWMIEFLPRIVIIAPDALFGVGPRVKEFTPQKGNAFLIRMERVTLK